MSQPVTHHHPLAESPHPLKTSVRYLKGVGPHIGALLQQKGVLTIADLLYYLPYRYLDRRRIDTIAQVSEGRDRTIVATVITCGLAFYGKGRRKIFEMILTDGTGTIEAKWFHFNHRYMTGTYRKGMSLLISGEVTTFREQKQFIHPDLQILGTDIGENQTAIEAPGVIPLYSQISGLGQKTLRKIINTALLHYGPHLVETLPDNICQSMRLPALRESLTAIHQPPENGDQELFERQATPYHRRLKFEELFYLELGLALKKQQMAREEGIGFHIPSSWREEIQAWLPFELTNAQRQVIQQIMADMKETRPMNRLLQGDVGSGKTIVALIASYIAMKNGYQVALMAPTEILAGQHYENCQKLFQSTPFRPILLTSQLVSRDKKVGLMKVAEGAAALVIGTHALIQEEVRFQKLGLAIIDEQHRFGVLQRAALKQKGKHSPDVLVMTATPIPRTLAMTLYGDLDLSIIDEFPPGRKPIITRVLSERDRKELYQAMQALVTRGEQIYVVYPLVAESEKIDLKNATDMAAHLKSEVFPQVNVALLHGRMDGPAKTRIMQAFKRGEIQILVSTTVIEVGIDVPNATCMVVEHAERFGLSQLHQLRGRIGRGGKESYCYLIYAAKTTPEARRRLKVMAQTQDGFKIAEEDLNLRGPGDFLGTRQWGLPDLRFSHLIRDALLLSQARELAFQMVEHNPKLEGNNLKYLKFNVIHYWMEKLNLALVG